MATGAGSAIRPQVGVGPLLPVRIRPIRGEAIDSFLERLAVANHLHGPELLRVAGLAHSTDLPIAATGTDLARLSAASGQPVPLLKQGALTSHAGIIPPSDQRPGWRQAGRAWAPGRRSQICPACLATDEAWRISWRHPWVATCIDHRIWLHDTCPACELPFRSQRHSILRSIDAIAGTCGNPAGKRGQTCQQAVETLEQIPAPDDVIASQRRIYQAIDHQPIDVTGEAVASEAYLANLKALTVLLLHLARQPGAEQLAPWTLDARVDHARSAAGRGARWSLAPPADPRLRGRALAAADSILSVGALEEAAQRLGTWIDLTPPTSEGRLGWLADHTDMTPLLTRLIMAATSTRRRLSTLLSQQPPIERRGIPQVLPAAYYDRHLAGLLDVTDATGRLFASLCLTRLGHTDMTWSDAATTLGLPADLGIKTARACSAHLLCSTPTVVAALRAIGTDLTDSVELSDADYCERTHAVRRLAATTRWYRTWAHRHTPGARATSRIYAITWLWAEYAGGHIATSPGWTNAPTATDRSNYRHYATRLNHAAREALIATMHPPTVPNPQGGKKRHVRPRS